VWDFGSKYDYFKVQYLFVHPTYASATCSLSRGSYSHSARPIVSGRAKAVAAQKCAVAIPTLYRYRDPGSATVITAVAVLDTVQTETSTT
jgi:hypothetical protein